MVKAVQAEDSVEQHFDGLLKERVPAQVGNLLSTSGAPLQSAWGQDRQQCSCHCRMQVGLLIGKPSVGSRDLVLVAVPTPSVDGKQVCGHMASGG